MSKRDQSNFSSTRLDGPPLLHSMGPRIGSTGLFQKRKEPKKYYNYQFSCWKKDWCWPWGGEQKNRRGKANLWEKVHQIKLVHVSLWPNPTLFAREMNWSIYLKRKKRNTIFVQKLSRLPTVKVNLFQSFKEKTLKKGEMYNKFRYFYI